MGEAGNHEISSSVDRSYLNSLLPVVPLKEIVPANGHGSRVRSCVPVKVGVIRRKCQ